MGRWESYKCISDILNCCKLEMEERRELYLNIEKDILEFSRNRICHRQRELGVCFSAVIYHPCYIL